MQNCEVGCKLDGVGPREGHLEFDSSPKDTNKFMFMHSSRKLPLKDSASVQALLLTVHRPQKYVFSPCFYVLIYRGSAA